MSAKSFPAPVTSLEFIMGYLRKHFCFRLVCYRDSGAILYPVSAGAPENERHHVSFALTYNLIVYVRTLDKLQQGVGLYASSYVNYEGKKIPTRGVIR